MDCVTANSVGSITDLGLTSSQMVVLVIDDAPQMRDLMVAILRTFGIENIDVAQDGVAAVERVARKKYDLITCDLMMKPMSGFEFLRRLRASTMSPNQKTPTIIITGNSELDSVVKARNAGTNEYLVKPVSPRDLWVRIQKIVQDRRPFVKTQKYCGPAPRTPRPDNRIVAELDWFEDVDPRLGEDPTAVWETEESRRERRNRVAMQAEDTEIFTEEALSEYRKILVSEVSAISILVKKIAEAKTPIAFDWTDLYNKTHDLKGHSGSFGFSHVNHLADCLCDIAFQARKSPDSVQRGGYRVVDIVISLSYALSICVVQELRHEPGHPIDAMARVLEMQATRFLRNTAGHVG